MNKVQKIREWVKARLGENTSKQSLPQFYGMMEEDARFLDFLDSLQKEPTGNPLGSTHAEFRTAVESLGISQEEHDRIVDECIYGKESELVDADDLPNKEEESVSEDLEKVSKEWLIPQLDKSYAVYGETKQMELTHFDGYAMLDAIEFGAKWQKTKDESATEDLGDYINELSKQFPEVSFAKLSRIAVRVSRWQRNQDTKNKLPEVINRTGLDEYAYQCAYDMSNDWAIENPTWHDVENACKLGANWQKENLWKSANGDDLPEYDREVIALLDNGKVVFAHRPPEYWDGKDITTGKVTRHYPKTYDKGGWNIPNIKYWLDVNLPKEIEL